MCTHVERQAHRSRRMRFDKWKIESFPLARRDENIELRKKYRTLFIGGIEVTVNATFLPPQAIRFLPTAHNREIKTGTIGEVGNDRKIFIKTLIESFATPQTHQGTYSKRSMVRSCPLSRRLSKIGDVVAPKCNDFCFRPKQFVSKKIRTGQDCIDLGVDPLQLMDL